MTKTSKPSTTQTSMQTSARTGLSSDEVLKLQREFGKNELVPEKPKSFFWKLFSALKEPTFLLLIIAATVYFILGEPRDGLIMLGFVIFMIAINVIQEWRTDKTLAALKSLSVPKITVIRDSREQEISSTDLVPGDLMLVHEGIKIPADGWILTCSDFRVNESTLTGEVESVWKKPAENFIAKAHSSTQILSQTATQSGNYWLDDYCYAGTLVTQGSATIEVSAIGAKTEYGKIGTNVASAPEDFTPLQQQVKKLVKFCAINAAFSLVLVAIITWFNLSNLSFIERLTGSILSGITLAMTMIPEEFPVILTVFLSMGAWRLAKKQSLIRHLPKAETLGSVSVLCTDKTGTLTENKMVVQTAWSFKNSKLASNSSDDKVAKNISENLHQLIETMGLGCETDAYDPMEKAMLDYCNRHGFSKKDLFSGRLISEYPFTDKLKMMGHVWKRDKNIIIAIKGSPESVFKICKLSDAELEIAKKQVQELSVLGLRVIAVATDHPATQSTVPAKITDCRLELLGLIGLSDPPRAGVAEHIATCRRAGVRVVMITGDNAHTATAIASKVGIINDDSSKPSSAQVLTGAMLDQMSAAKLKQAVQTTAIFARVTPEHKMRIVKALSANGEVVAMIGDGVNDAPALKYAHIGIAMGGQGNEVSREAADLILMDDNFSTIVASIRDGRRIYDNIKKAFSYVFATHIPVVLASLLAPLLGIDTSALLLLPLHVVILELLIDPTCSIVLERQPADCGLMSRPPRAPDEKLLSPAFLFRSLFQGFVVFATAFGSYYIFLQSAIGTGDASLARTIGLTVIILSNLFLVQVNSSEHEFAFTSIKKLIHDPIFWASNLGTIALVSLMLYTPLAGFLKLAPLSLDHIGLVFALAFVSVFWYEIVKLFKFIKRKHIL